MNQRCLFNTFVFLFASVVAIATPTTGMAATGDITTIAGEGPYTGDGGPATNAVFSSVENIAYDASGNLYISDSGNHRVRRVTPGGIVTTVAGTGEAGFSGDGGVATAAKLDYPSGLAVDSSGNLYIADSSNARIRRVSPAGQITTVAGNGSYGETGNGGPATSAQIGFVSQICVDPSDNLYFTSGNKVRKVALGIVSAFAGTGTTGYTGDGGAATSATFGGSLGAIACDSSGNVFIADSYNFVIRKVTGSTISTFAGTGDEGFSGDGGAALSAEISYVYGIGIDSSDRVYISDDARVRRITANGSNIVTVAGSGAYGSNGDGGDPLLAELDPTGLAFDAADNLTMGQWGARVRKVTSGVINTIAGKGQYYGDGGSATTAGINGPSGIAFDSAGNLYIADANNHVIRKVTPAGIISTFAGTGAYGYSGDGGAAASAEFGSPANLAFDSIGNLFVFDQEFYVVRKISPGGTITTVAGNESDSVSGDGGAATAAGLGYLQGLALDSAGNLYLSGQDRIRRVTTGGTISTIAGTGIGAFGGDNGPAVSAQLDDPAGMAFDAAGNLFIADSNNGRIRRIAPSGQITTVAGPGTFTYGGDGGLATSAGFIYPYSLAVDATGNIYVSDSASIRRFAVGGVITRIAGVLSQSGFPQWGFSGDGGPATNALLSSVSGLAFDASGNLFVADSSYDRIRKIELSGSGNAAAGAAAYQAAIAAQNRVIASIKAKLKKAKKAKQAANVKKYKKQLATANAALSRITP